MSPMRLPTTAAAMPASSASSAVRDQPCVLGAGAADGEADGRVADPAAEDRAAVDAHQVAVAQPVVVGDAVHDRVVDGGADDGGEGGRRPVGAVAEEGRSGAGLAEDRAGGPVEVAQADADGRGLAGPP